MSALSSLLPVSPAAEFVTTTLYSVKTPNYYQHEAAVTALLCQRGVVLFTATDLQAEDSQPADLYVVIDTATPDNGGGCHFKGRIVDTNERITGYYNTNPASEAFRLGFIDPPLS